MRFVFTAVILSAIGVAYGAEPEQPVSVLNHGQATPTTATEAPAAEATPAASAPTKCRNGRCCTGPNCRLYNVEESVDESCRQRLFGGYVRRSVNRTVYRPVRR